MAASPPTTSTSSNPSIVPHRNGAVTDPGMILSRQTRLKIGEGAMRWQLQEAKQRFSELIRHARAHGPQVVTKHGEEVAVVVSIEEYRRLTDELPSFKELLLAAPDLDALEISRPRERARVVELAAPDDTP